MRISTARGAALAAGVLLLAGTSAAALAPSAMAATPCHSTIGTIAGVPESATITCTGVSFQYRVKITCLDGINGTSSNYYGPYVSSGHTSSAQCGAYWRQSLTKVAYQQR